MYFHAPEVGVGLLGVVDAEYDDGGDCEWIQCWSSSDGDGEDDDEEEEGEDGACDESGVVINREMSVFVEEGAVEVREYMGGLVTARCLRSVVWWCVVEKG